MTTNDSGAESQSSGDAIVSMTISGVPDNEQCPLCRHLDQVTIDINDRDTPLFVPPLHDGCRCVQVYNCAGMRPEFRTVNYHRPPREMIEKYLAPQRLVRSGQMSGAMTPNQAAQTGEKLKKNVARVVARLRQKVVRAEKFELVDSDGKARAVLALSQSGQPGLVLADRNGKTCVKLGVTADGKPALELNDQTGKVRAWLQLDQSGQPELVLSDQNGNTRVVLNLLDSGQLGLALFDQNGKVTWNTP